MDLFNTPKKRYIGIAHESGDPWWYFTLLLYNRMIKIAVYTRKPKRPRYYYYSKESFDSCFNEEDTYTPHFKWFFGIVIDN